MLGRQFFAGELYFRWAAIIIVLAYLVALVIDPIVYGYHEEGDYVASVAKSAALNGMYAFAVIMFFSYNLLRLNVLAEISRSKLMALSLALCVGCLFYRNPISREYADRIPIFKDLLPASVGFGAILVLPIGTLILKRAEKKAVA